MGIRTQLSQYIGNPLEWPAARKASLVLYTYLLEQLIYAIVLAGMLSVAHTASFVDVEAARHHVFYFKLLPGLTLALIIAIQLLQHRLPHHTGYEHVASQFFSLTHVYYGYTIGLLSLPVGLVMAGATMAGLIFFHRRAVLYAFGSATLLIFLLSFASMAGVLPYAPLATSLHDPTTGSLHPFLAAVYLLVSLPHLVIHFAIAAYILKRWRQREEEVRHLSSIDPLTGLMNRRSITEHLEREQARRLRSGEPLSVVMIDLDHFKQINDTWGHQVGDDVLVKAAQILKNTVRQNDYVGRFGGEEFLIILPGMDKDGAALLAERIRKTITASPFSVDQEHQVSVTASLGLCACNQQQTRSITEIIRLADDALYKAKHSGRDRLVISA